MDAQGDQWHFPYGAACSIAGWAADHWPLVDGRATAAGFDALDLMEADLGRFLAFAYIQYHDALDTSEERELLAVAVSWGDPGAVGAVGRRGRRLTPAIAEELNARAAERNEMVFGALSDMWAQPLGEVPAS